MKKLIKVIPILIKAILILIISALFICALSVISNAQTKPIKSSSDTSTINLLATEMRTKVHNQDNSWSIWDTSKCEVLIRIFPNDKISIVGYAINATYPISTKLVNNRWYESEDSEGRPLVIVLFKNKDKTYNVLLQYDNLIENKILFPGLSVQYLHAKQVYPKNQD